MEVVARKQVLAWLALVLGLALIAYQVLLVDIGFFDERIFWIFSLAAFFLVIYAGILLLRHRTGMASTVGFAICVLSLAFLATQFISVLIRDLRVGAHR